jgi:tRNA splicing ligase
MTTKQDSHRIISNYVQATDDMLALIRTVASQMENSRRAVLVVTNAEPEAVPNHPLADRMTA